MPAALLRGLSFQGHPGNMIGDSLQKDPLLRKVPVNSFPSVPLRQGTAVWLKSLSDHIKRKASPGPCPGGNASHPLIIFLPVGYQKAAYGDLLACLDRESSASLYKAFGYGKAIFAAGNRGSRYDLERFMEKNKDHPFLASGDLVGAFYTAFARSKWIDGIREYSDTTVRLLGATGLFRFKNLPELSYREILSHMLDVEDLRGQVFGEMTAGFDVLDRIAALPTDKNNRPLKDVKIIHVKVIE